MRADFCKIMSWMLDIDLENNVQEDGTVTLDRFGHH